jgi:hypothetical protein
MKNYKQVLFLALLLISISAAASAQQVFVANLSGAQEVPAVASGGRGVCQGVLNAAQTSITVNCRYSGLTSAASAANIHGAAAVGANASALVSLGPVSGTSGTIPAITFAVTAQLVADLRANKMYINIGTANNANGEVRGQIHIANASYDDYDGDGRTDLTIFRTSTGTWYNKSSLNGSAQTQAWGLGTDLTSGNADFDGDGISDYAAIRVNPNTGGLTTYILQSETNTMRADVFGNAAFGDQIGTGDFDGDGKFDIGIFRNGTYIYIESSTGQTRYFQWGQTNDFPLQGDFDADGKSDFAVVRSVSGQQYRWIRRSSDAQYSVIPFGVAGDANMNRTDFDGDGESDNTIRRIVNGQYYFYTLRSSDGQLMVTTWGSTGDALKIGDFDGDGKSDYTVVRTDGSNNAVWYILQSTTGQLRGEIWGLGSDRF